MAKKPAKKFVAPMIKSLFKQKDFNTRIAKFEPGGFCKLRVWHYDAKRLPNGGVKCPRLRIKCGDCDNKFDIYYAEDSFEINGVNASLDEWKKILLPILNQPQEKK